MHHRFLSRLMLSCVLALLWPAAALAQSPTGKPPRPMCYPGVNGYPKGLPHVDHGAAAIHVFWACTDPKTRSVYVEGWSCPRGQCSEVLLSAVIYSVTRASAKVTTANAAWDQHVALDCRTDQSAMCAERRWFLKEFAKGVAE